jgi:hypothetical protein
MNPARVIPQQQPPAEASAPGNGRAPILTPVIGPIAAHEIAAQRWQDFCRWSSQSMAGVVTDIERDTGKELRVMECLQKPLQGITARVLANGVVSIGVTVLMNDKPRVFEIAGPNWLRVHCNAAGLPLVLEIGYTGGKMVLHFTGATMAAPVFSGNSWGE